MSWLEAIVALVITLIICLTVLVGWVAYLKYTYEGNEKS